MSPKNEMQTISDYLQLSDWTFEISMSKGSHLNYFWLRSSQLAAVDLLETIDLPKKPFCVLITYWDAGGGASVYGSDKGWRKLGDYAISDVSTVPPKLQYGADNAQMLLDKPIVDPDLLDALSNFDEPLTLDDVDVEDTTNFWSAVEAIEPYCYFSYGLFGEFTFIARGHELFQQFLDRVSEAEVEAIHRERESALRAKIWRQLGPECGPELCIEENCGRLRIQLAVRCFIHQSRWGK